MEIAILPGDGIGPEICREAVKVIRTIAEKRNLKLDMWEGLVGGAALDIYGKPLPEETLEKALNSRAVLLGAVGGPKWDHVEYHLRPERALLALRERLGLYANLRPVVVFPELISASPLKEEVIKDTDILIIRELTGDVYFGTPRGIIKENGKRVGINTMRYDEEEIRRIARIAFESAMKRKKKVTSVDKSNVLECSVLWREVVSEVGKEFPEVELKHMYVDNCAMQLLWNPRQFDVIVTSNLFGDILSDEGAMITGSIGLLPSASLGVKHAMYEPIHGSAPDIAGQNSANPLATILSVAMMFRHSLAEPGIALAIEEAVRLILKEGYRTKEIWHDGEKLIGTSEMGDLVVGKLSEIL
ncbi:MAG: 3-isopropylmalate dehydrogenase [Syntrophales bacterium]|nr:3-isopropylmalate dehydrogenase [Syntrophales bacterium]